MLQLTERRRAMLRAMGVALAPPPPARAEAQATAPAARLPRTSPQQAPNERSPVQVKEPGTGSPSRGIAVATIPGPAASALSATTPALDWLVVGEALTPASVGSSGPGDEERLLDNMLRAVGRSRAAGAKHGAAHFVLGDDAVSALGAGVASGGPDLDRLRSTAGAPGRCLLVLGRVAATSLLGSEQPLGALRGRVHDWHGHPVVVTFSLAYLLRHPAEKAKAWADLCLAAQTGAT